MLAQWSMRSLNIAIEYMGIRYPGASISHGPATSREMKRLRSASSESLQRAMLICIRTAGRALTFRVSINWTVIQGTRFLSCRAGGSVGTGACGPVL